ncbi:MAG TPA: metallophosphoesterase family protein [Terriglobales bacterium]|jgi:predicted phosphodiesterase|nr:metallophosphoesterase family protein [Terriglobales bacterium]
MRLAIVSDIHGNLTALEAVIADLKTTSPDLVLQGGDLVVGGPHPAEVIDRICELGWAGVVGNTDEMLWAPEEFEQQVERAPKLRALLEILFHDFAATRDRLEERHIRWLQALPPVVRNHGLSLLHASPGDLWQAPMPDCEDQQLVASYGGLGSTIVVYGHIHRPYVRQVRGCVVANSGSIGMPYDGDPRASYLLVENGEVTIRRVEYDVEAEIKDLLGSGYPRAAWLAEIRRQGKYVPPF